MEHDRLFKALLMTAENRVYNAEMATLKEKQEETLLELTTEWSREGAQNVVLRQLKRRFGRVPVAVERQMNRLSERELGELGEALLDFGSIADAREWVARRVTKPALKSN